MSIKGVCANRYLAMKEDGRLLASVSKDLFLKFFSLLAFIAVNLLVLVFIKSL